MHGRRQVANMYVAGSAGEHLSLFFPAHIYLAADLRPVTLVSHYLVAFPDARLKACFMDLARLLASSLSLRRCHLESGSTIRVCAPSKWPLDIVQIPSLSLSARQRFARPEAPSE